MKFERSDEYEAKLFEKALCDEKHIIKDAKIRIVYGDGNKLKAYCEDTNTYLQFPRGLRKPRARFVADVVEVINDNVYQKYYRAMNGSIRREGSDEVVG